MDEKCAAGGEETRSIDSPPHGRGVSDYECHAVLSPSFFVSSAVWYGQSSMGNEKSKPEKFHHGGDCARRRFSHGSW